MGNNCTRCDTLYVQCTETAPGLCPTCAQIVQNPAFLYCGRCSSPWGVLATGRSQYGFVIEGGKTYYTDACVLCSPKKTAGDFKIIQAEQHARQFNILLGSTAFDISLVAKRSVHQDVHVALTKHSGKKLREVLAMFHYLEESNTPLYKTNTHYLRITPTHIYFVKKQVLDD
jgi:hypothetical protein